MPCITDPPSHSEILSRELFGFLNEMGLTPTGDPEKYRGYGDLDAINTDTALLCKFLKTKAPEWVRDNCSLELQIFWRDHQQADKDRAEAEARRKREKAERQEAVKKLTPRERELLGIR